MADPTVEKVDWWADELVDAMADWRVVKKALTVEMSVDGLVVP